jgi:hydroxymethylglutaryl-CoA synthase
LYLPQYRVQLEDWCAWNDEPWGRVKGVVGRSFRMRGPNQSVYTLAANAVFRLIRDYDIDPSRVGMLALGTESSSDNSAGAIIIKGMLNDALVAHGKSELARDCEVPEFKHACLGGVYGLKAALRYLAADGAGRLAIVVCADIAEYAIGSSGEPTQGAGAVAMLVDGDATLLEIDLTASGSDSEYRVVDFRKPFARFRQAPRDDGQMQDLPVFNGRYSTSCYIDATHHAMASMLAKRSARTPGHRSVDYFDEVDAVFMHRPYHRMPATGWVMSYLFTLASDEAGREQLRAYCADAGLDADALLAELSALTPFHSHGATVREDIEDVFPVAKALRQYLRKTPLWEKLVGEKLGLGSEAMRDLGNLYTAALPAWIAAGLHQASTEDRELAGQEWLALGYGSGDAAEAMPMRVGRGWRDAAARINFQEALGTPSDLTHEEYLALHEGHTSQVAAVEAHGEFVVDHIGTADSDDFRDLGIEYYRFVEEPSDRA